MPASLTPAQIRGARGMLDWCMLDLAKAAGVSVSTIKRMESGAAQSLSEEIRLAVQDALEAAGLSFLADEAGTGMKLRW